jgi:hypothetical protein
LLTDEVNQFWQNLLSKLVGFPLDAGSNGGGGVSTSITSGSTTMSTDSVANASVMVS